MRASINKVAAVTALALAFAPGAPISAAQATPPRAGPVRPAPLVVPTQFPTIQAAIDAAAPGATIRIRPGTYTEQLTITKSLTITGSGMPATVIRAPATLHDNEVGERNIVEVTDGASVSMSRLAVAGPGSGSCEDGALTSGIRVRNEAHLDLRFAAVRAIHDTPFAACPQSAVAVYVGDVPGPIASATVDHSWIADYQGAAIIVLGFGSTANITDNRVVGPGQAKGVATDGIEFPVGAVGTISRNVVSGNVCPPADESCGTDWFTQFQIAGIGAGGWGPGTRVTDNIVIGNQVGMLLGESDEISGNTMIGNDFFGLALLDGTFVVDGGRIRGGGGGVWAIADTTDTHITLDDVKISHLSGPRVGKVECCGFSATVTTAP